MLGERKNIFKFTFMREMGEGRDRENRLGNKIFPIEKGGIKPKFLLSLKFNINEIHTLPWKETERGNYP